MPENEILENQEEEIELTQEEKEEQFYQQMVSTQALHFDENGLILANAGNQTGIITNPIDYGVPIVKFTKQEYLDFAYGRCILNEDLTAVTYDFVLTAE